MHLHITTNKTDTNGDLGMRQIVRHLGEITETLAVMGLTTRSNGVPDFEVIEVSPEMVLISVYCSPPWDVETDPAEWRFFLPKGRLWVTIQQSNPAY